MKHLCPHHEVPSRSIASATGATDVVVQDPGGEATTLASDFVYNALAPTMSMSRLRVASISNIGGDLRCGLFGWALVFFEGATVPGVAVSSPLHIQAVTPTHVAGKYGWPRITRIVPKQGH